MKGNKNSFGKSEKKRSSNRKYERKKVRGRGYWSARKRGGGRALLLSGAIPGLTFLVLGGVTAVNLWSQSWGARGIHPFSLEHLFERTRAFGGFLSYKLEGSGQPSRRFELGRELKRAAQRYSIPPRILSRLARKFGRKAYTVDRRGLIGPMGVSVSAARAVGSSLNPFDPRANVELAARILFLLRRKFGSFALAEKFYWEFVSRGGIGLSKRDIEYYRTVQLAENRE